MSRRAVLTTTLVFCFLLVGLLPTAAASPGTQAEDSARVRLVHAVADAPAADILIDGAMAASRLGYAGHTGYLLVAGGDHEIDVQIGGASVAQASFTVAPGQALTAVVAGTAAAPEVMTFQDDLSPLVLGNIRLNAVHLVTEPATIDVVLSDGSPVFQGLAYGQSSGGIDIPANLYPLAVVPAGDTVEQAIRPPADYALRAGMLYRLLVLGGTPDVLLLETPVNAAEDSVWVGAAHAIPDAPAVDLYLGDILVIPYLESGQMTPPLALPLGTYDLTARGAGADSSMVPIASASLDLSDAGLAGQARTVAAVSEAGALGFQVYEDDFSTLEAASARVVVHNAIAGATLNATLDDGTAVAEDLAFASTSPSVEFPAGVYSLTVETDGEGSATTEALAFNGGVLYSFLVTGTPEQPALISGQFPLNQQPDSAAAVAAEEPPATPVAAQPQATEEAPQTTPIAPPPTQAPPQATAPPAAAPTGGLIGLVYNLNPGANLHIRQYPSADARSLGLVTNGTVLSVLGRAGEPDFQQLVDLPPDEDLDPTRTWLWVEYNTPEGGTITGWAIAQYIQVTEDGERVRLAELDPLPSDAPGSASAGVAAPTTAPVQAEFYAVVFNLNPGVNLHIRRMPDITAESLALVPAGTVLEPLSILEDYSWTFVRYLPEGGGSITGWTATPYLQFVFRGQTYLPTQERIDELLMRSLLTIGDPNQRGEVAAGTTVENPTPSGQAQFRNQLIATVILDPGANLHLRRTPDAASASLALIPSGATMLVYGKTSDGEWLQVNYDNTEGWVASAYVDLRYNDRRVDIEDVPDVQP